MNAVQALKMAFAAGIRIEVDEGDLLLNADAPPSDELMEVLVHNKAGIIGLLKPHKMEFSQGDWQSFYDRRASHAEQEGGYDRLSAEFCAFEDCTDHWLILNPPRPLSAKGCIQCGKAILPHDQDLVHVAAGTAVGILHTVCAWRWTTLRRWEARRALMWLLTSS